MARDSHAKISKDSVLTNIVSLILIYVLTYRSWLREPLPVNRCLDASVLTTHNLKIICPSNTTPVTYIKSTLKTGIILLAIGMYKYIYIYILYWQCTHPD